MTVLWQDRINIRTFKRSALLRHLSNGVLLRHLSNGVLLKPVEPVIIPTDREPIPNKIEKPQYVKKGFEKKSVFESFIKPTNTYIQNEDIVKRIRQACRLGRRILNHLAMITKVGVSTNEIDYIARQMIIQHGAYPSPLGYRGFPKSICTSVNNVVVHGIPDSRLLQHGDIINLDVTVYQNGVHGDLSETYCVGNVDDESRNLVRVTRQCLDNAIAVCKPKEKLSLIGNTISGIADNSGFAVCPYFVGHGIGEEFHGTPQILHHRNSFGGILEEGMVFTIEPVVCAGSSQIKHWKDGWTVVTQDNKRAAQFEETVYIHGKGVDVLTADSVEDPYLQPSDESREQVRHLLQTFRAK